MGVQRNIGFKKIVEALMRPNRTAAFEKAVIKNTGTAFIYGLGSDDVFARTAIDSTKVSSGMMANYREEISGILDLVADRLSNVEDGPTADVEVGYFRFHIETCPSDQEIDVKITVTVVDTPPDKKKYWEEV